MIRIKAKFNLKIYKNDIFQYWVRVLGSQENLSKLRIRAFSSRRDSCRLNSHLIKWCCLSRDDSEYILICARKKRVGKRHWKFGTVFLAQVCWAESSCQAQCSKKFSFRQNQRSCLFYFSEISRATMSVGFIALKLNIANHERSEKIFSKAP